MKPTKNNNQHLEKALELLPWYSAGLLSEEDSAYIEEKLAKHPELQEELTLDNVIAKQFKEDKRPLDLSSLPSIDVRLNHVLGQLENNQIVRNENRETTSFTSRAKQYFSQLLLGSSSRFQYIATATASIAVVALAYAFISPLILDEESTFRPATANTVDANKNTDVTVLLVGLSIDSNDPRVQEVLKDIETSKLSAVPGKDGMYRLALSKKLAPAETKALIQELVSQKELVWFAGEAY